MKNIKKDKNLKQIIIVALLAMGLLIGLILVRQQQDLRKQATGSGEVNLTLNPSTGSYTPSQSFQAKIKLHKTATRGINISGAEAVLTIPQQLTVSSASCLSPFNGTPFVTQSATSVTLLCAISAGTSPVSLSTDIEFASISYMVKSGIQLGTATVSFTSTRVTEAGIPGQAPDVSTSGQSASYTISTTTSTGTPTPTKTPTPSVPAAGSGTPTRTPTPSLLPSGSPTPTRTPTPSPSIVPTRTPTPVATLTPTPPSGNEHYNYDVGQKTPLTINIGSGDGGGDNPSIRFRARLANISDYPDLYLKLRVINEESLLSGATYSCESAGNAGKDFYIPMSADENGIYWPVSAIDPEPPSGFVIAHVTDDGWVSLDGITSGNHYTFYLKGPKTRSTKETQYIVLQDGQASSQDFDWSGDEGALEAGDLPDPNTGGKQDCTVNVVDLSLIEANHAKTDEGSLDIADVNYDGIISGQDIAIVVNTLATKPDDE
ncbi:hypothetical protein HYW55_00295 [Candidatus Gottesmanbacteria bacterium]|nr:hypothetical protein [Candidatus Gottesmanbacteria bacterium]